MMAVFITAVTLVALLSLVGSSVSNSTFSRDRSEAVRYTTEVSEWIRTERDTDWNLLASRASATGSTYCVSSLSWDIQNVCRDIDLIANTKFTRELTLFYDAGSDPNLIEASIITRWSDSGGAHESRTVSQYTNWRSI